MSRGKNAGRNDNIKTDSKSSDGVEQFKGWGKILTNKNSIQEEIMSRSKLGNVCYHSM